MGADIHLFLERKMKSGNWACVTNFDAFLHGEGLDGRGATGSDLWFKLGQRDYTLFGALASVRGDGLEPRGLPDDLSEIVQEEADSWVHDAHSHSWMYADEFADIYHEVMFGDEEIEEDNPMHRYYQLTLKEGKDHAVWHFVNRMCNPMCIEDEDKPHDFRFVFWFDN